MSWSQALVWLVLGAALSGIHTLSVAAFVAGIRPGEDKQVRRRVAGSYFLRYALAAALLALAIRHNVRAGLVVCAGFWVTRWLGVYLGSKGKLSWHTSG